MSSADDPKRQADAPDAPDAKKPKPAPAAIYDDIAVDYAAVRANPFKRHVDVEEATFLRAVPLVEAVGRARARGLGLREDQLGAARGGGRARRRGELRGGRGRVHGAARVSGPAQRSP
jgi:hypothetical protein